MNKEIQRNVYRLKDLLLPCDKDLDIAIYKDANGEYIEIDYNDEDVVAEVKDLYVVHLSVATDDNMEPVLQIYVSDNAEIVYMPML